ncbi:MAG: hypothetical protein L0332_19240 [Chloroflexi bacterium]|nr:hypothetical protein [Chloroflexota bacterium]MCI0579229.1 hypothetical protein [Chloroflexota bacterium]MCI0650047.1 hypothetical protein [Chloroflexota bacterium]MCI0728832.1 hypothetical protein [Chloroflexota bacterium]
MNDLVPQPNSLAPENEIETPRVVSHRRRLLRRLGFFLLLLATLLTLYGGVAYLAWRRGQMARSENIQQATQAELSNQVTLAQGDINAGNFALALRRLEWVLERAPDYSGVVELQRQAQQGLNARLTPTPLPTPTATPEVVQTPATVTGPAAAVAGLEELMAAEEWETAVAAIAAFQYQYPDYERRQTDTMLYNAYINLGLALLSGPQVELGLFYLSQAEKLGDLPQAVIDQRTWAELYLWGIAYYGVDWGTTAFYFRGLCAAAPFYQNSCEKLHTALVAYGDQYAFALDWCPARELYAEARRLDNNSALNTRLQEASAHCLEATPTPTIPLTGTVTITGTAPILDERLEIGDD